MHYINITFVGYYVVDSYLSSIGPKALLFSLWMCLRRRLAVEPPL